MSTEGNGILEVAAPLGSMERESGKQYENVSSWIAQTEIDEPQVRRLAALGHRIAVIVHECRSMLQRLSASHERLALAVHDRPDALPLVVEAQKANSDLTRLVDGLRAESGSIQLYCDAVNLREIWQKVWADLQRVNPFRCMELVEELDEASLSCQADPFRLEQVFRNLFENALAACAEPIRICIRCSEVDYRGQSALRIAICDNGPGLTAEQRERAFEPFYTTRSRGLGLGLAISRRIVEAHRGVLVLGNAPGGAEFFVILPRNGEAKCGTAPRSRND